MMTKMKNKLSLFPPKLGIVYKATTGTQAGTWPVWQWIYELIIEICWKLMFLLHVIRGTWACASVGKPVYGRSQGK